MLSSFGHLSGHMLIHIVLMNAVAPLAALALVRARRHRAGQPALAPAMLLQLVVLWGWHAPPVMERVMQSSGLHLLMQASLLGCALWFWTAVFKARNEGRWRAILSLLVTSKLFCLLGVLFVFSPRPLFELASGHHSHAGQGITLADQQLAGLLMLVACPATYVLAGIVIAGLWFGELERGADATGRVKPRHAL